MKTADDYFKERFSGVYHEDKHEKKVQRFDYYDMTDFAEQFAAQSVREYKDKLKNEVMSMRMNRHPVTAQVTIQVVVELVDSIDLPSPPTNKG